MNFELRDPKIIMKLSRLGSFHQSRLSFLRSFLNEFKDWKALVFGDEPREEIVFKHKRLIRKEQVCKKTNTH